MVQASTQAAVSDQLFGGREALNISNGGEDRHDDDQPKARQQTFNICMDEPVDYGELGTYLAESRGLPTVGIGTNYHSTWLDNTKAKFLLGWRPEYDLKKMADAAWNYQRAADDPRIIWYPG